MKALPFIMVGVSFYAAATSPLFADLAAAISLAVIGWRLWGFCLAIGNSSLLFDISGSAMVMQPFFNWMGTTSLDDFAMLATALVLIIFPSILLGRKLRREVLPRVPKWRRP